MPEIDEVGPFFVVLDPVEDAEMADVLIETDLEGFAEYTSLGGIAFEEIIGIYLDKTRATEKAQELLDNN